MFLKRRDNMLKQFAITSFGEGGCADGSLPWYVRAYRFKWGIDELLINGRWGPYKKYNGDQMNHFGKMSNSSATPKAIKLNFASSNNTVSLNDTESTPVNYTS